MSKTTEAQPEPAADDARPEPAAAAPAAAPAPAPPLAEIVDRWWLDHFPGSHIARDTQAWNHCMRAAEELKRRLIERNK